MNIGTIVLRTGKPQCEILCRFLRWKPRKRPLRIRWQPALARLIWFCYIRTSHIYIYTYCTYIMYIYICTNTYIYTYTYRYSLTTYMRLHFQRVARLTGQIIISDMVMTGAGVLRSYAPPKVWAQSWFSYHFVTTSMLKGKIPSIFSSYLWAWLI